MNSWLRSDNHLFTVARRGKRLTPPLLLIVLVFTFYDTTLLLPVGGMIPAYLMLWAWLRWFEKRPFSTLGVTLDGSLNKYWRGVVVGLLMVGGWIGVQVATGHLTVEGPLNVRPRGVAVLFGLLVLTHLAELLLVAIEELLFRGWMLPTVGVRYGTIAGVLVSAAFFSLSHFWQPILLADPSIRVHDPWPPLYAFNLFLWSILAALWTLRDGSLWGPIAFHATSLWLKDFVFSSEPSGIPHLELVDPNWLTGGTGFGGVMEGLPATGLLLVGVLAMVLLYRRDATGGWTN